MREIKFRAWDIEFKEMCYDCTYLGWTEGGKLDGWEGQRPSGGAAALMGNEFEIMQYTGLHDKNGVDVYEDDIIILEPDDTKEYANEPHYLSYGDICTVEWSNTNLAYYLMPVDENKEEQQMDYFGAWSGWNWIKVIGNIWEHKHLLDEANA